MISISLLNIPIKTYRFHFATDSQIRLPGFPSSAWRGAFGHALKKTVCIVRNTPCYQYLLKNACVNSTVFETPPPANTEKMRKYTEEPYPFVLQFPITSSAADALHSLDMISFGHGQSQFPLHYSCPENSRTRRHRRPPANL